MTQDDVKVRDPYLIIKIADNPEKFIGAAVLGNFIKTPTEAMLLVKMLGDQVSEPQVVLGRIFQALSLGTVADALSAGGHSTQLQVWLQEIGCEIPVDDEETVVDESYDKSADSIDDDDSATLFELVNNSLVQLPTTVKQLGEGLFLEVLSQQPAGQAHYVLDHVLQVSKFGQIGTVKQGLEYEEDTNAAVVVDCSGSMGRPLGEALAASIVRLADELKCDLILVSTVAERLPAGTFGVQTVLEHWQSGWTFYNQLIPSFRDISQSYDVVVTVADYDSHLEHKAQILRDCAARIGTLYDINVQYTEDADGNLRTSFLAECLGQLADRVVPVFVGAPGMAYSR